MNKRIVISLAVIVVLLLYLLIDKQSGSNVPELEQWEGTADELVIKAEDNTIKIVLEGESWLLNEKKFPADKKQIENLEKKLKELMLTDLISAKPHYLRYDLTPEKAMRVTAKRKGAVLRDILIGKKSPTNKHTYIKFQDKPEIYMASGNLTTDFSKSVPDLRDKEIFKIDKGGIEKISLKYRGRTLTFSKTMVEDKTPPDKMKKDPANKPGPPKKEEKWVCNEYKGIELDKNKMNGIVGSFNPVRAESFPEMEKKKLRGGAQATLTVTAYKKDIVFEIFSMEQDKNKKRYLCTSSESPYVFTLSEWKAKKYFNTIEDLKKK